MEFQTPTLHNKNLIKHLEEYMIEWNISAEVLADDIGVASIYGWFKGVKPNAISCEKLFDYFGVDFAEKFAYYTADGRLMFEGTHETFLMYMDFGKSWFNALQNEGKIIRKTLPIADGECAECKTYDVLPESFNTRYSRVYEVHLDGKVIVRGNGREVCKSMGIAVTTLRNRLMMSKKGDLKPHEYQVYHTGYDFKRNLEVAE